MPTPTQVQQSILSAQLAQANLVYANNLSMAAGFKPSHHFTIKRFRWLIAACLRQYNLGDLSSQNFLTVYGCLCSLTGQDSANPIDPNYQGPNFNIGIAVTNVTANYNEGIIEFSNQQTVQILNYSNTLAKIYGPNPKVMIYTPGFVQDEQTEPTYIYNNPTDPTSGLVSITWSYPVAVTGYIAIWGSVPVTTPGSGTSGGGSILFDYTQAALLQDGNGSWYLPLTLPNNYGVAWATSNGNPVGAGGFYTNFSPNRLYGFIDNSAQTIVVKVV